MSARNWVTHVSGLGRVLRGLGCRRGPRAARPDRAFTLWRDWTLQVRRRRQTVFLVGNGASASMASHMAADLAKNAQLRTEIFSDLSLLTAISNDMGYEHVFSEPLSRRAGPGDMLVAISSSGRSPNVLHVVTVARRLGLSIVTLTAMDPDNPLRRAADLSFHAPARTYGDAESAHAAVLHYWMDLVADRCGGK